MVHEHGHHDACVTGAEFNQRFVFAILFNALFVMLEVTFAWTAHSSSLMADALHNLGDVLSLVLAMLANRFLSREPTVNTSYGFKKMTVLAAMTNALLLVFTCGILVADAMTKLLSPQAISAATVVWVAGLGILVNGSTALLFRHGHADLNIRAAYLHLFYDAILSLAVVCVALLIAFTHWLFLDPLAGILIALIILRSTWSLLADSFRLIMDGVPSHISLPDVLMFLQRQAGVAEVHDLHIWAISTRETAMSVHLWMPEASLSDAARLQLEMALRDKYQIHHVTIQIEQDKSFCMDACNP